jgi:MFS family permease
MTKNSTHRSESMGAAATRRRNRVARGALISVFLVNGLLGGSLAVRMPALMEHMGADTGSLGLAFTASVVAALATMQLSGWTVTRFGSRRVTRLSVVFFCLATSILPLAPSVPVFATMMVLFGTFGGALGVAMNAQAVALETAYGRPVISGLHAMHSIGGVAAAVVGAGAAHIGTPAAVHIAVVAVVSAAVVTALGGRLLVDNRPAAQGAADSGGVDAEGEAGAPVEAAGARTGGRASRLLVLSLGAIAFCFYLGEAAVDDWSAIYLHGSLGTSTSVAALGYGAFAVAMAVGRLFGDRVVAAVGRVRAVRLGALAAGGGLMLGLLVDQPVAAVVSFGVFGLGMCVVAPVTYSATGNLEGIDRGKAIAQVTVIGYCGLLVGPAVIGTVGQWVSVRAALLIPAALALVIALLATAVRPQAAVTGVAEPPPDSRAEVSRPGYASGPSEAESGKQAVLQKERQ